MPFSCPDHRWPALEILTHDRPPARHEVVLVRIVRTTSRHARYRTVPGGLVLPEPSPPVLPVLPVSRLALLLNANRTGRHRNGVQARGSAPPPARAALGEPVLSQRPERGRTAEDESRAARATSAPRTSVPSSTW